MIFKMKNVIVIITFIVSTSAFSQEPPPLIKFNFKTLATDTIQLFEQYEFRTFVYKEEVSSVKNKHLDLKRYAIEKNGETVIQNVFKYERGNFNITNDLLSFFINGTRPNKNDIILLSIRDIKSGKYSNIYIRSCYLLDFGEEVTLKNLLFKKGNYFYDMCKSKEQFEISCQGNYDTKISLENMKKHKTSLRSLNRFIKDKNCN